MTDPQGLRPTQWLSRLSDDPRTDEHLYRVYGNDKAVLDQRKTLLREAIQSFQQQFGDDGSVRIFRAPGRINLRGMHVDTHGGWLNLMTHQRETVVVAAADPDGPYIDIRNVSRGHRTIAGEIPQCPITSPRREQWREWARALAIPTDGWAGYVWGTTLRSGDGGMQAVVHGDIPQGSSLSSSASLCCALLMARWGLNGQEVSDVERLLAVQDAEWFAGARVGLSDQLAILLGRQDRVLAIPVDPVSPDPSAATYVPWPDGLDVLVADSGLPRKLSAGAGESYVASRFSYSMAMAVLEGVMRSMGMADDCLQLASRLATVAGAFSAVDGPTFYDVLLRIPEQATLAYLRDLIGTDRVENSWSAYFPGSAPDEHRLWPLRGPLLFGVSESERARTFSGLIANGHWSLAGQRMTAGHDGDRVYPQPSGAINDDMVVHWQRDRTPIETVSGSFLASVPALDGIVDTALGLGALGASLTGAGLGGSVVVLCASETSERIAEGLRAYMVNDTYHRLAGEAGLTGTPCVIRNVATNGAGELVL